MSKPARTTTSRSTGAGLALIQGQQWAITESGWQSLLKAARAARAPKALVATAGENADDAPWCLSTCDGVATVRVRGPLMKDANWLWSLFGWTSYETLARAYAYALAEPSIRAIVFDFDSPGGAVAGVSELAAMFYNGRGQKPQESFVSGMCCSAALWLCASIGRVSSSDVGLLGSIGTMFTFCDTTKYDRKLGIEERTIISRQTPKKNADPASPEGKAEMQGVADDLADVFIDALAVYRDVPRDTVLTDFGRGAVMVGARAVTAGLADEVTTEVQLIQDVLEELDSSTSLSATLPAIGGRASTATTSEAGMKTNTARAGRRSAPQGTAAATTDQQTPAEVEETPGATAAAVVPAPQAGKKAKAKAKDEGADDEDEGTEGEDGDEEGQEEDDAKKKGAEAHARIIAQAKAEERNRVSLIRALSGPADVIQACLDDADCTPEAAAYRIMTGAPAATPKPAASRLAALRTDDAGAHPSATAPKPAATTPKEAARASVDRYYQNTKPGKGATSRNA